MTPSDENAAPGAVPPAPQELAGKVERAAGDSGEASELRVELVVAGGVHGERHEFRCELSGAGELRSDFRSDLGGDPPEDSHAELPRAEFEGLLRSLDVAALDAASRRRPRIPPDSLVGRLRVSDGRQDVEVTFMADPEQAEAAGETPPPAVTEAVDAIYRLGSRPLEADDVRPLSARKG